MRHRHATVRMRLAVGDQVQFDWTGNINNQAMVKALKKATKAPKTPWPVKVPKNQ